MARKSTTPAGARKALQQLLDAAQRRDIAAMSALVNRRSLESGPPDPAAFPQGVRLVLGEPREEGDQVLILMQAVAEEGQAPVMQLDCVMVVEDGQWKLDILASGERMMGAAMDQVTSTVAAAMDAVGDAMAEGLQAALGGSATVEGADAAPEPLAPDELLPLAEMRTLPKTQAAVSEAVGAPVIVQAAMDDLLQPLDPDGMETIFTWFEDKLFAGWAKMLAPFALKNRLRAVRIEAATRDEQHQLAIDGSDLVYRMRLPENSGFFQDAEIAALLPGVLAGLPDAIDTTAAGHRLLPLDEEEVDLDRYRRRIAPRFMRRISAVAGHAVSLEADWSDMEEISAAGRVLSTWGLNRVLGGVALAGKAAVKDLTGIRLVVSFDLEKGYVKYGGGLLELGLTAYCDALSECYEHQIAAALTGA